MAKKKLLTKIKTKISTRTMLLVALGLVIIGGAAFGLIPHIKKITSVKTVFNVSEAKLYTGVALYSLPYSTPYTPKSGQSLVNMVVYSGQDGSGNAAAIPICRRLKDLGVIKYEIDYSRAKATNISKGYCPKRGRLNYQAYNSKNSQFFNGSCWGGHDIWVYYQVECPVKPYTSPYTSPYTRPYTNPYTNPYSAPYTTPSLSAYDYQVVQISPYNPIMVRGSTQVVSILIKNTGTATWYRANANPVRLGAGSTYAPADQQKDVMSKFANSDWISPTRPTSMNVNQLAPGGVAQFTFTLKAPMTPGIYKAYFTPVVEGVGWMRDVGIYWQIQVR